MAHTVRAQACWMSVAVSVAVIASNLTWVYVTRGTFNSFQIFNNDCLNTSKAHYLLKVNNSCADGRLTWVEEWKSSQLFLDSSQTWITVKEDGFYLLYLQVTYGLNGTGGDGLHPAAVDLFLIVDYRYGQGEQEFAATFDTRLLTHKEQDARLGNFLLLRMKAGEQVSVRAHPKEQIKYSDIRPFSSYLTMIRYADY